MGFRKELSYDESDIAVGVVFMILAGFAVYALLHN